MFDRKVHPNTDPQEIRNAYLHGGEFHGLELSRWDAMSNFRDPSFDAARRALFNITKAAIIEWLKCGGVPNMPLVKRKNTWRRCVSERALAILPIGVTADEGGTRGGLLS